MKKCETCNKNDGVMVACAGSLPISVSYCQECLDRGAEPYWTLRSEIVCCGGLDKMYDPENFGKVVTYFRGQYCTLEKAISEDPYTIENEMADLDEAYTQYMSQS